VGSATLAERILAGDRAVIDRLVESSWPALRWAVPGALTDPAELRQAARAELVEIARAYEPARDGDFAAHAGRRLRRLVDRVLRRERRRRDRQIPLDQLPEELHPRVPAPPGTPPRNRRVRRALRRLPPRLRAVIVRLYYRELTAREIAAQDGTHPDELERAHRRALARMRRDLRGPRP
jgi:RNA polymerase sigma factor (sigma-70 family)